MGPNNPQDFQQPGQTFGPGGQPPVYQTPVPPSSPQHPANMPGKDEKTKKLIIIIAALLGVFAILAIIVLVSGGGKKKQAEQPAQNTETQSLIKEPTAIDVENVNNSISDDVTNLSTDNDFPADNLSDEKLDL